MGVAWVIMGAGDRRLVTMWQTLSGAYKDLRDEGGSRKQRSIKDKLKTGRVEKRGKMMEERRSMKDDGTCGEEEEDDGGKEECEGR